MDLKRIAEMRKEGRGEEAEGEGEGERDDREYTESEVSDMGRMLMVSET